MPNMCKCPPWRKRTRQRADGFGPSDPRPKNVDSPRFLNGLFESTSLFHKDVLPPVNSRIFIQIKKAPIIRCYLLFYNGGSGWIRTIEVTDNRFTVCPLWPLGNTPTIWSWWTDSNPRPADYKSAALPAELHQLIS